MGYHSADYNHDWRLGIAEFTRVTVLHNTSGPSATITGCYKVDAGTVDGFAPDPTREISQPVTLTKYHSADYNRDGRIDSAELERVIELYNYRYDDGGMGGSVRTGQYSDSDPFSIDGFGLGPVTLSHYSFDTDHIPVISTNSVPTGTYRLIASFLVDGQPFIATTSNTNNGLVLDGIPAPGVYECSLYWLQDQIVGRPNVVRVTIGASEEECRKSMKDCICGDEEPVVQDVDKGQCFPYRVKQSCNAPTLPTVQCNDNQFFVVATPGEDPAFYVSSRLFDSTCEVITDYTGAAITTIKK